MPEPNMERLAADDPRRAAIWRLFEMGQLDEDTATAHLLALDLEARRAAAGRSLPPNWEQGNDAAEGLAPSNGHTDQRRANAA